MTGIDPDAVGPGAGGPPQRPTVPVPEGFVPSDGVDARPLGAPSPWRAPPPPAAPAGDGDRPFLDRPGAPPATRAAAWRWLLYALVGFVVGQVVAGVFGIVAGHLAGKSAAQMTAISKSAVPPEWYVVSTLIGLWAGFLGAPWLASRLHGTGHLLADLGVRFRWVDLWGLVIGLGSQIVISLLYLPFRHDIHDFNGPTNKLTGGSHGGGFVVIALFTVILAPFMEELFFRGLLFRALARLFAPTGSGATSARARGTGVVVAVALDGLLFGLAHGEWTQLAGLALFGVVLAAVSFRTGRLGMNMVSHASFNLVAVVVILHQRGGVIL